MEAFEWMNVIKYTRNKTPKLVQGVGIKDNSKVIGKIVPKESAEIKFHQKLLSLSVP